MAESLLENGMLDAVKTWLEPLPDRSLPALAIQRALFNILLTVSLALVSAYLFWSHHTA